MNPSQVSRWVEAALLARSISGSESKKVTLEELDSLRSLKRGVFASKDILAGEEIKKEAVDFQMPCLPGQLTSGEFGRYRVRYVASREYKEGEPIIEYPLFDNLSAIRSIIHDVKGMLFEAQIVLGDNVQIELSHHYGFAQFRMTGAVIVSVVNRNYCKKLIVLLPGQRHPEHWHQSKDETFQLLYGTMEVVRDGETVRLKPGQTMVVEPGVRHSFMSETGAIFEEVSTTHMRNDSFYTDQKIQSQDPMERKTVITDW
jgi:quercetin dioxygenase-like cupin family protein